MENLENVCPTCEQSVDYDFKEKHISGEKEKVKIEKDRQDDIQKKIKEIQENNEKFKLKSSKTERVGGFVSFSGRLSPEPSCRRRRA
jgi:hypothetical protein